MRRAGSEPFLGLMLFLEEEGKIRNIFSEPLEESGISGSGPESKSSWETVIVLKILPRKTDQYFDIELKEKGGPWNQRFHQAASPWRGSPMSGGNVGPAVP